jgi:hypothetical protein
VQEGMSEQEVIAARHTDRVDSVNVLGGDAVMTVRFVNGKAALKTFDQPGASQK